MPYTAQTGGQVRFSHYAFNPKTGELSRAGMRLRLEVQPGKVLALLIEAKGNLVSRSELIAALWPDETEGDFDRRLDKAVAKLRASLNDDPLNARYVATLKGRGYYFLGEVVPEPLSATEDRDTSSTIVITPVECLQAQPEPPVRTDASVPNSPERGTIFDHIPMIWKAAIVVAFAVMVTFVTWWIHGTWRPRANRSPVVLVLGFHDSSQPSDDGWVSSAIAEWLSTDLKEGGELQVVQTGDNPAFRAWTAENRCGRLPQTLSQKARQTFDADLIVYGEYSLSEDTASGTRWKLDVCIKDTARGGNSEPMTVVGGSSDIPQLVLEAGDVLRSRLGLRHLSNQSLGYLRASLPSNPAAARLYTEGSSALRRFQPAEAVALLTEATQLEPNHAAVHAALSAAWSALGYVARSEQEALIAQDLAKNLSPTQQLEYQGLACESRSEWSTAIEIYTKLLSQYPSSLEYSLKLANAQTHADKALLALELLRRLRAQNHAAQSDPRVDLAEGDADSVISDFRGQLQASTQAEMRAETRGLDLLAANARMQQGNADDMLGNWSDAVRLWRLAGQGYEAIGDRSGMADSLNRQAELAWKKGNAVDAAKLFQASLSLSEAAGDKARLAYALAHLGGIKMAVDRRPNGGMPEAVKMYRQAASTYHAIGDTAGEGYVLSFLADEAMQRTSYEEARSLYVKAMTLSQAANDRSQVASRLLDLGIVAQAEGHASEAEQLFQRSSNQFDQLGQRDLAAIARTRLGIALFRSGKVEDAESMLQSSLDILRGFGRLNQVREVLGDLAEVELMRNPIKAEALTREGLDLDERSHGRPSCASRYAQLAEAELAEGKVPAAEEAIRQAFLFGENALPLELLPNILLARGNLKIAEHYYAGAGRDFDRSLKLGKTRANPYLELQARLGLAEVHVLQTRTVARTELNLVQYDADQLGYGIFAIKIGSFLHSID